MVAMYDGVQQPGLPPSLLSITATQIRSRNSVRSPPPEATNRSDEELARVVSRQRNLATEPMEEGEIASSLLDGSDLDRSRSLSPAEKELDEMGVEGGELKR